MSYSKPSDEELIERLRSMARKQAHDGGLSPRPEHKTWTSREQSEALYFALTKVGCASVLTERSEFSGSLPSASAEKESHNLAPSFSPESEET